MYFNDPSRCPKCDETCVLNLMPNQSRENTCPKCGLVFFDAHDQFESTYTGLFYGEGDETDPPRVLFRDKEAADKYIEYLKADPDEDAQHDSTRLHPMECSVYGAYWNSSDDNPYEGFYSFIPAHLDDEYKQKLPSLEVTATRQDTEVDICMNQHYLLCDATPVYFCRNNQRWYVFAKLPSGKIETISINNGPGNFVQAYMSAMHSAITQTAASCGKGESLQWLTWEEFKKQGGTIALVLGPYTTRT